MYLISEQDMAIDECDREKHLNISQGDNPQGGAVDAIVQQGLLSGLCDIEHIPDT